MRILKLRRRDEGAIAIMSVVLIVFVTIPVAAFTTDFGSAYVVKRNLATGADAAALAAAKDFATSTRKTCAAALLDTATATTAQATGDSYLSQNAPKAARTGFTVACDTTSQNLDVTYKGQDSSSRFLGAIYGAGDYQVSRSATAEVGVAADVTGLRPYMICGADLPTLTADSSPHELVFPNAVCGSQSGNWYSVDCPTSGSNGTKDLASNTEFGCDADISIIDTSNATNDAQRISILQANCPQLQANPGCLTANTGKLSSQNIADAWDKLLGQDILMPVFFKGSVVNPGNNARYPVYAFVGVKVCGYNWQSKSNITTAGACAGAAFSNADNSLVLVGESVIASGSTKTSTCALGNVLCDFGARTVHLVK